MQVFWRAARELFDYRMNKHYQTDADQIKPFHPTALISIFKIYKNQRFHIICAKQILWTISMNKSSYQYIYRINLAFNVTVIMGFS